MEVKPPFHCNSLLHVLASSSASALGHPCLSVKRSAPVNILLREWIGDKKSKFVVYSDRHLIRHNYQKPQQAMGVLFAMGTLTIYMLFCCFGGSSLLGCIMNTQTYMNECACIYIYIYIIIYIYIYIHKCWWSTIQQRVPTSGKMLRVCPFSLEKKKAMFVFPWRKNWLLSTRNL